MRSIVGVGVFWRVMIWELYRLDGIVVNVVRAFLPIGEGGGKGSQWAWYKAPHPNPFPEGRGAVKLASLRPHSGGERGHVKLCSLRRRSRGGGNINVAPLPRSLRPRFRPG